LTKSPKTNVSDTQYTLLDWCNLPIRVTRLLRLE
jgi:hypothetical protein